MSRQGDAKKRQGYDDMSNLKTCGNCKNFKSKMKDVWKETNKRCLIGNFAVKKSATCNLWEKRNVR